MATETVTREELTLALEEMKRETMTETLRALGITVTSEMGQTLWPDGSSQANNGQQPEPIIDVDKMADLMHDLTHNQEALTAEMGKASHLPGLCDNPACPICRDQRRVFSQALSQQVERATQAQSGSEIDRACEWAGVTQLRDQLTNVLAAFRQAGSPGLAKQPEFEIMVEGVNNA